jgi:hypothetical protein
MCTGPAFAQAKVVIVKQERYTKPVIFEGMEMIGLYLKATIKNIGDTDAKNVVVGGDCTDVKGWTCKTDASSKIDYLAKQDKEECSVFVAVNGMPTIMEKVSERYGQMLSEMDSTMRKKFLDHVQSIAGGPPPDASAKIVSFEDVK